MIKLIRKICFYLFLAYVIAIILLNSFAYFDNPPDHIKLNDKFLNINTQIIGEIISPIILQIQNPRRIKFVIKTNNTKILVETYKSPNYNPQLGDIIQINSQIQKIDPQNKFTKSLKYQNIYYKITDYSINSYHYLNKGKLILRLFGIISEKMLISIQNLYTGLSKEFLPALLIGDKIFLQKNTLKFINGAGLSHVIAISGMHVGSLYGFLLLLFKRKTSLAFALISLLFLWFYAGVTGFYPSCMRATIMFSVITIATLHSRESFTINNLVITAMIMLFFNPKQIFLISFQLSFLGVFSILYFYEFFKNILDKFTKSKYIPFEKQNFLRRTVENIKTIFLISLSVQMILSPIIIYYFKALNISSILFNLFIVPFLSIIMVLGLSSTILGFANFLIPIAKILAFVNNLLISSIFGTIKFFYERFSFFINIENFNILWLIIIILGIMFVPIFFDILKRKLYRILFFSWICLAGLSLFLQYYWSRIYL